MSNSWGQTSPDVKKGDTIIVVESPNAPALQGKLCKVTQSSKSQGFINVSPVDGIPNAGNWSLYTNGRGCGNEDIWILADREAMKEWCKKQVSETEKQLEIWNARLDFYENYESEDEYIADKIDEILKSRGKNAKVEAVSELRKFLTGGGIYSIPTK